MQSAQIIGYLGKDPETKYTQNGAMMVTFSVGVSVYNFQEKKNETSWWDVTAWGKLAESMDKLAQDGALTKGKQVYCSGDLSLNTFTTQNGETRTNLRMNPSTIRLLGKRDE